ncbi:hypothetical protein D7319_28210 [Streptomyces radicis]|uniref:ATP-grasp domain-containing protein n=1 Tax=Streptomyces radicis TaxID=1750517 RepID=A0A3A9VUU9_9ACTN|nr:hypothetical protein D7319_28210 [Streptomyces radicis]RKN15498.1 hypothetical protein D7318_27615 [Streptomyces radicis]
MTPSAATRGNPAQRILYIFPDRGSRAAGEWERDEFWPVYLRAADEVGLGFGVANPEHIVLAGGKALWNGEPLCRERDVIVHDIRSEPALDVDLWTSLTLVCSLREMGFWPAIPLSAALLFNDKFATAEALADSPIPLIPSVRITTGRDLARVDYQALVPDAWFPVFVKPASWGRGLGCVRCPDRATLDAVLGLASGSGAAMLVQPSLGDRVTDLRVVAVEGEIVALYDRVGGGDSHVANVSRGGSVRVRTAVEPGVRELVELVHRRFDLPYVCVDLLRTPSGELWLSELELDGAVSALFDSPQAVRRVVGGRFLAYAARLRAHRHRSGEPGAAQRRLAPTGRHER